MINLLPQKAKREIVLEERFKIIFILSITFFAFLTSLFLVLFSVYTSVSTELKIQKINFDDLEKKIKNSQIEEMEKNIEKHNLIIKNLASFYKEDIDLVSILEKISKTLPSGIYLDSLNFNRSSLEFSLTGFSPDRDTLVHFKENLEKESDLGKVFFPSSNWSIPKDIEFNVNLKIVK